MITKLVFKASIALVLLFVCAAGVRAQATRVYVSSDGSDTSPCSRDKPCRTITYSLTQVVTKGEVVVLDSGDFDPFSVTQSMSVTAAPGAHPAITVSKGNAVEINSGQTDVVIIRGLTLNGMTGSSKGISFVNGGALHVEDCLISGFPDPGIYFSPGSAPSTLSVNGSTIRNNLQDGIRIAGYNWPCGHGPSFVIDRCRLEGNGASGVHAVTLSSGTVRDSVFSGNGVGFTMWGQSPSDCGVSQARAQIDGGLMTKNGVGLQSGINYSPSSPIDLIVRVSNAPIVFNETGVAWDMFSSILSRGNNTVESNGAGNSFKGTYSAK